MTPQQQSVPFDIRIYLPNGTTDGIKIVEISNWVGLAIAGPRSRFDELRERKEFKKAGVYILTGPSDPDLGISLPTVYIGEGDGLSHRLNSHYKLKGFWSTAVFFTGKEDYLNKAHIQYLEARLVSLAREAKLCILDNANTPQLPALSEMDTSGMEVFLKQMLLICGILAIDVFHKAPAGNASTRLLYIKAKGLTAIGFESDAGFVVQAGSQSPKDHVPTTPPAVQELRQSLLS